MSQETKQDIIEYARAYIGAILLSIGLARGII